ncbi:hexose transporter [Colletotrichum tabaci]|uniref:Hexose transporter n=1 Tax=Colletotrichum tabaci TaxID=1209068 RepID=A0AAV9T8Y6_9PEZI
MSSKPIVDHDDALFSNPDLLRLYLVSGALIASACIGYNSSMMNGIQDVDGWVDSMLVGMIGWTVSGSAFDRIRSEAAGAGIPSCIKLFTTAYNICWDPFFIAYPVEILLFPSRAKGVALLMGSIKDPSFFSQSVNSIDLSTHSWKY